jgi:hypothetical protein
MLVALLSLHVLEEGVSKCNNNNNRHLLNNYDEQGIIQNSFKNLQADIFLYGKWLVD